MNALQVRGLTKHFGAVTALDQVDLAVPTGTLASVLGPSGCGKTTLLRLVAGFEAPDAGTVELAGTTVAGPGTWVPAQARRIGYLPQEGALFPHLDVARNIGFGLPRAQRRGARVTELLDLVELPASMATRQPHELSGGQQQRVALARALAPSPHLVLLDEPFSALDAALRESTGRAVARALRAAGATGLLVTHDQNEALALADQVVTLRTGRLVQAASPTRTYQHPADPEQALFVGGATVLEGVLTGVGVRCALGDLRLRGEAPAPGPVRVVVRPEQLHLAPSTGAAGVRARVEEVSYYGHDAAVRLVGTGWSGLARITGSSPPTRGDQVTVRVEGAVLAFAAAV